MQATPTGLTGTKRARDEDESLDDMDRSKKQHTLWGGFYASIHETEDYKGDADLPALYREGVRYLHRFNQTKTVYELIHELRNVPLPPASEAKGENWVNVLNSPMLDSFLVAIRSTTGLNVFDDTLALYGAVRGHSLFMDRQIDYLCFVLAVIRDGNDNAFEFIRDRGCDVNDFFDKAVREACKGPSVKTLEYLNQLQPQRFSELVYAYLFYVQHPAVAEYMVDRFRPREDVLKKMAGGSANGRSVSFLACLLRLGLPFSHFDDAMGPSPASLDELKGHGIVFPVADLNRWADRAAFHGDSQRLRFYMAHGAEPLQTKGIPGSFDVYKILQEYHRPMTTEDLVGMVRHIAKDHKHDWLDQLFLDGHAVPSDAILAVFRVHSHARRGFSVRRTPFHTGELCKILRTMIKENGVIPPENLRILYGDMAGFKALLRTCGV